MLDGAVEGSSTPIEVPLVIPEGYAVSVTDVPEGFFPKELLGALALHNAAYGGGDIVTGRGRAEAEPRVLPGSDGRTPEQPTAEQVQERLGDACTALAAQHLARWCALPHVTQTAASGNRVGRWPPAPSAPRLSGRMVGMGDDS